MAREVKEIGVKKLKTSLQSNWDYKVNPLCNHSNSEVTINYKPLKYQRFIQESLPSDMDTSTVA